MRIVGEYAGPAVVTGEGVRLPVSVELFIEVDEIELDGRPVDGYRTWAGRITAGDADAAALAPLHDLVIELPDGRRAPCAILDDLRIVGFGAPPFD